MRYHHRKCTSRGQKPSRQQLIDAYCQLLNGYIERGWDAYLVSFMFHQLPGGEKARLEQMKRNVTRVKEVLTTRIVRFPKSAAGSLRKPIFLGMPDLPVPKKRKTKILDYTINDGLHYQAILAVPPKNRLKTSLPEHFKIHHRLYLGDEGLRTIQLEPLVETPKKAVRYTLKSLKRHRFDEDEIGLL